MVDKRPDEIDDFRIKIADETQIDLNQNNEIELDTADNEIDKISIKIKPNLKTRFKKTLLSIFCGLEELDKIREGNESNQKILNEQNESESRRRVANFYSLNRTKFEKYFLNLNLCLILMIATFLYVFFSVPSFQHLFITIQLNSTRL